MRKVGRPKAGEGNGDDVTISGKGNGAEREMVLLAAFQRVPMATFRARPKAGEGNGADCTFSKSSESPAYLAARLRRDHAGRDRHARAPGGGRRPCPERWPTTPALRASGMYRQSSIPWRGAGNGRPSPPSPVRHPSVTLVWTYKNRGIHTKGDGGDAFSQSKTTKCFFSLSVGA